MHFVVYFIVCTGKVIIIIQVFYILTEQACLFYELLRRVLKSPYEIVGFSISSFGSVQFSSCGLKLCCFVNTHLGWNVMSTRWTYPWCKCPSLSLIIVICLKSTLSGITIAIPAFSWLLFSWHTFWGNPFNLYHIYVLICKVGSLGSIYLVLVF